jgi:RHS repeat-associated protein
MTEEFKMDRTNSFDERQNKHNKYVPTIFRVSPPRLLLSLLLVFAVVMSSIAPVALATKLATAERPVKPATTTPQAGHRVTFYGPQYFIREAGSPVTVTEQFSIPSGVVAPYIIEVQNGGAGGWRRVSNATIQLNGVELFTQNEINDNTPVVSQTVTLQSSNELAVKLTSSIGSFLKISVSGIQTVLPAASLVSIDPILATQGQSLVVSLQGQDTHWVQGETRASFGEDIAVNGAYPGEPGEITVTSATTATAQLIVQPTAALYPRMVKVVTTNVSAPEPLNLVDESVSLGDAFTVVATSSPGASSTTVTTIAGLAGNPGFADGVASQARFQDPAGLAVGADDSIYIADGGNNRIRRLRSELDQAGNPQWVVSTLAGNGTYGFADGPAATAEFKYPQGVAVDAAGVVFVADTANHRIRKIATDGTVSTFAGDGSPGFVDGAGNQARFNSPRGVAVDQQGNIYVADTGNAAVRVINSSGQVSTLAGDGTAGISDSPARFDCPSGIAVSGSSVYIYLTDKGSQRIRAIDSTGAVTTITGGAQGFLDNFAVYSWFAEPSGIAIEASGTFVVTDAVNSLIRQSGRVPAGRGWTLGVSTLAGSGERGQADGAGSVATFLRPRGIATTTSSAIIVADTGNHTLRRLTFPPSISSFSPASARPGETVTIDGARFDARGPNRNTVRFTRTAEAGGGQVVATVTSATQTSLAVVVPDDAATGPVTVQTEGGTAVSPTSFEVLAPLPVITGFSPQAGPIGTTVTLTGQWLKAPDGGDPLVTFAGRGDTRLPALVTFASRTQVQVLVPNAAVTGHIELTTVGGQASTAEDFTVTASQDFQITVAPASASAVQGSSATYVAQVTSTHQSFTQLARLTATGLPAGVVATFEPSQITAGGSSTLTLNLAGANLAAGSYTFNINAAADIDGNETTRTASANLSVIAAGQTTLSGRVLSTEHEPIIGATISLDGHSATTDAAGAFLLTGVNAGVNRPVMIDGRTASSPNRTYPVLAEPTTIVAGEANAVPYIFYLPPIDVENEVIIAPAQTTVITTPDVPGLQLTVPAGANLRNRDNTPVTRVSITPVPIDRTPTPLPSNVTTAMVYTNQPGGAISDTPMPMVFPNLQGADPGTRADLYAFNHDTVQWYVYGYGRVSADGRLIEPEINPGTGQPYGLVDFSWYFPSVTPNDNPGDDCACPSNRTPNPVDLSTGAKIETSTDVSFGGARGGITLTRVFTSDLNAASATVQPILGRFGRGTKDSYDVRLDGTFEQGGAGRVISPEERSGRLFSYVRTDPDGSFVFETTGTVSRLGSTIRRLTNGTFEHRFKDGSLLRFDSSRRPVAMVDRNGNTTTLSYTGSQLTTVTDPVGRSITFEYDGSFVSKVTDSTGRRWLYGYSSSGSGPQLATVTDPLDNVVHYTYTSSGLSAVTDGRGHVVKQIFYNSQGRVSEQRFAEGGFEQYTYQTSGTIVTAVSITDSLGRTETKRFNAAGYVTGVTDQLGQATLINRDITTNLNLSTLGACGCAQSNDQHDARGNLTARTDRLGQTEHWEYEPVFNNVTRAIDRMGRVMNFGYDSRGNLTSVTNEFNQQVTLTYDDFGQLTSVLDPLNHATVLEYDTQGNMIGMVDALNHRATFEYDGIGRMKAAIDPLNRRQSLMYDALGRIESTTDASNAVTHYTYDANGNLTVATNALQQRWQWGYDGHDRVVSRIDPLNRTVQFQYNTEGELIEVRSPLNRITRYDYDSRGNLSTITDALNQITRLTYDNRANLTTVVDQRGKTTTYTYDELARVVGKRNALGQFMDFSYNAVNRLTALTDQLGRHTTIDYDNLHRPTAINYPDATVTYSYDAAGRMTEIADTQSTGNIVFGYDDANRLTSETTPAGVVSYAYNAANQRISMTAANAATVNYGYDTAGRLQTITQGSEVFTYAYDALSRLASLQRPNGIISAFDYDSVGRLKRLSHSNALSQALEELRFTYTLDDQISSITSVGSPTVLPAAKNAGAANAANRITQFGSSNYTFNAAGQTTSRTDGQGTTGYQWDTRGRLTSVALPNGQSVSYGYDALARRTSRTASGVTTSFLYDGQDVVRDSTNDETVEYLNGPGVDNKLRQDSAATGSLYFLQDHLGSTKTLTDSSGAVVEQSQYESFGESAGSSLTRYGFTGRERDSATGLLYYRARWLDPQQGRFLSEDLIGLAGGLNLYAYVNNNPLSYIDPAGLSFESFMRGFLTSFVVSGIAAFLISAAIAATGGVAAAILAGVALGIGAYQLYEAIDELVNQNLCPDEFDEKLGELIGGILGGLAGGGAGAKVGGSAPVRNFMADETGSVPNPFGKKGGPAHQGEVGRIVDEIEGRGNIAQKEYQVKTPDGEKGSRYVDVVEMTNEGDVVEMYQVGKQTKAGNPVSREQRALNDIEKAIGRMPKFMPYNCH